jgi:hypothetical protein
MRARTPRARACDASKSSLPKNGGEDEGVAFARARVPRARIRARRRVRNTPSSRRARGARSRARGEVRRRRARGLLGRRALE